MNIENNRKLQDLERALKNNDLSDFINIYDELISYKRIQKMNSDEIRDLYTILLTYLHEYIDKNSSYELKIREGDVNLELKNYKKAEESYLAVLTKKQDLGNVYYKLGNVYYKLGNVYLQSYQIDKAIESFKQAIKYKQDDYWSYSKLGDAFIRLEDFNQKLKIFVK